MVMPGARMLKIVVMKLMAPRIEEAPARCSARMREIHRRPGMTRGRQRRVDRPAGADAGLARRALDEQRGHQQSQRRRQQPERHVVHARERHVRRPDHDRHEPVAEAADQRRHDHEEHHDQAVRGHEHVEGVRAGENLHARLLQFEPHADRQQAADHAARQREHQIQRADVLVVGGDRRSGASRSDDRAADERSAWSRPCCRVLDVRSQRPRPMPASEPSGSRAHRFPTASSQDDCCGRNYLYKATVAGATILSAPHDRRMT